MNSAQLHDWKRHIVTQGVLWPDGLISSSIDAGRNRLVYGVLAEKGHVVEEFFSSLSLPCDLLLLEAGSIPVNLQNVGTTDMIVLLGDRQP